jgi:steroid 5-alpha reductase family enzyme
VNFVLVAAAALAAVVGVHGATFLIARRVGRYNVVDIAWGVGFVAVAPGWPRQWAPVTCSVGYCCWC